LMQEEDVPHILAEMQALFTHLPESLPCPDATTLLRPLGIFLVYGLCTTTL
jgi:hypothetical protein